MDQIKIGKFIAQQRKEQNLTQRELGEKLGVSYKAVSKWETGKCLPDASLYNPLCGELNITLTELFSGERIETERIPEKADEVLSDVMENTVANGVLSVVATVFTSIAVVLFFIPTLKGLDQTLSIITISAGLFLLLLGQSLRLSSWKRMNGKTVKNAGMGFSSALTLLFIGLKLTGYIGWSWIWVFSPLWIGISAVIVLLLSVWAVGRIRKKW